MTGAEIGKTRAESREDIALRTWGGDRKSAAAREDQGTSGVGALRATRTPPVAKQTLIIFTTV
jgi:hypothetical protein